MARPYDLVIYGATGYTGSLMARYLWKTASPSLRWAVAGRNPDKLEALVATLGPSQPDRPLPGVIMASINPDELENMASQTRVVLNTVGPFCKYGTPVVAACIEKGTGYVDSTGEYVWAQQLATEWHEKAMSQRAIIIPQCAIEASAPDLLALLLARKLQRRLGPMFMTIDQTWSGFSGGTIETILSTFEHYSVRQLLAAGTPTANCIPDAGPHRPHATPRSPVRRDRFLGNLGFNMNDTTDNAVVMRTWSLLQRYGDTAQQYGERFSFQGFYVFPSLLQGWIALLGVCVALPCMLFLPPLRWIIRRFMPALGTGPQVGVDEKHFVEWKATIAGEEDPSTPGAMAVMRIERDVYGTCAIFVAEAALTLLDVLDRGQDGDSIAGKLGGGVLTPASLGIRYVERLERAGLEWKVKLV